VKPGYARNFLIPQGLALLATPKNRANLKDILEARKEEEEKLITAANKIVEQLKKTTVTILAKAGAEGKLFGSINNINLSEELKKAGIEIDKKYIKIPGNTIKRTGKFIALVRLHRNVEHNYEFEIIPDAPSEASAKKPKSAPAAKAKEAKEETKENIELNVEAMEVSVE
jgi:large subunit ribosomal protein L9